MYDVGPDGADSSTKVDLSWQVFRLSGNKTLGSQSVTSNGAGGSQAEAIIRKHQNRAGPFLKFEKNHHMAARKPRFGCSSVSP